MTPGHLELLYRITERMTVSRDVTEVLGEITQGLGTHAASASRLWLYTTDEECPVCSAGPRRGALAEPGSGEPALHQCAEGGLSDASPPPRMHLLNLDHIAPFAQIARTRQPLIIRDIREFLAAHPGPIPGLPVDERQYIVDNRFNCGFGWPLMVRDEVVGVLACLNRTNLGDEEFAALGVFAHQAASAIKTAQLFQRVERMKQRLEVENAYLAEELRSDGMFEEVIGDSPALRAALDIVKRVAPTASTLLVLGETGTGKELIARAIHNLSPRRERALIKVNCGAISPSLVESELFGHERGAFTGALQRRIGRFEMADGGTLFMDEVGELSAETQIKLLRVLQEQEFERVGGSQPIKVDVRVVAATNRDLQAEVEAGRFRADLFYRLNVVPVRVPPLRERPEDIPLLARHFVGQFARRLGKNLSKLEPASVERMKCYRWPGNIRELQNVVERGCVLAEGEVVRVQDPLDVRAGATTAAATRGTGTNDPAAGPIGTLEEMERAHIARALEATDGRIHGPKGAALLLGLHGNTLRSRMERLGMSVGSKVRGGPD